MRPKFVLCVIATFIVTNLILFWGLLNPGGKKIVLKPVQSSITDITSFASIFFSGRVGYTCCGDGQLAITRAEGCNMGVAAFIQANGREEAINLWNSTIEQEDRYELIRPYLAFAPEDFELFQVPGYEIILMDSLEHLEKVKLYDGGKQKVY